MRRAGAGGVSHAAGERPALIQAFPDTWGVVTFRQVGGAVDFAVSQGHHHHFHPAAPSAVATELTPPTTSIQ